MTPWVSELNELREWAKGRLIVDAHILVQALDEIERLGALLEGRTVSCSQCNAAAEREATLLGLLAEARPAVDGELATVALIESGDPVALLDLLARIDAALGGGEEA